MVGEFSSLVVGNGAKLWTRCWSIGGGIFAVESLWMMRAYKFGQVIFLEYFV